MAKQGKTIRKILTKPIPANVQWNEIKSLLIKLGYKRIDKSGGSSRKFYHKEVDDLIVCHKPHPESTVDRGCISDIVQHLKEKGFV